MANEGEAWVDLRGNTSKLAADLAKMNAQIKTATDKATAGAKVNLTVIDKEAAARVTAIAKKIGDVDRAAKIALRIESVKANTTVAELGGRLEGLKRAAVIGMRVDSVIADTKLAEINARLQKLSAGVVVPVTVAPTGTGAVGAGAKTAAATVSSGGATKAGEDAGANWVQGFASKLPSLGPLFKATLAVAGLSAAAIGVSTFAVKSIAAFEQVQVAFNGLFGSKEISNEFLGDLQEFAKATPFEMNQLTGSAQRFLGAFGKGFRDELIPTLATIGDVAGALGAPASAIDRVTTALLQIKGKGRFAAEELMQIREALPGFDPVAAIASQLGISVPAAMKKLQDGAIGADEGIQLLLAGMKEFPGAAGAMERQSLTLNGRISTLKDGLQIAVRSGFAPLAESVGTVVDSIAGALASGRLQSVIDDIGSTLAGAVDELGPKLVPLLEGVASAVGTLTEAAGPALASVLPVLTRLLGPLAEILAVLVTVGAEVAETLGNGFLPVLEALASVLETIPVEVLSTVVEAIIAMKIAGAVSGGIANMAGSLAKVGISAGAIAGPIGLAVGAITLLILAMGQADEADRRKSQNTDEFTQSLEANTAALLANKEALAAIVEDGDATRAVMDLLNKSIPTDDLEQLNLALAQAGLTADSAVPLLLAFRQGLNDIGEASTNSDLSDTLAGMLNTLALGGKIELGDLTGKMDSLAAAGTKLGKALPADLVAKTRAEFGKYADVILGIIGTTDDNASAASNARVAYQGLNDVLDKTDVGPLTEDQKALVNALIATRDVVEDTDYDAVLRNNILLASTTNDAAAAALELAEAQTGVSRNTEDSGQQIELFNQFMLNAAESADDFAVALQSTDFTAFSTALSNIATPAERAKKALEGIQTKLAELQNGKVDFTQATIAVEALLDRLREAEGFVEGGQLDITTAGGGQNVGTILTAAQTAQNQANLVIPLLGGQAAIDAYLGTITQIRDAFVEAGGDAAAFDTVLRDNALDPIVYEVTVSETSKEQLDAEITKLGATLNPLILAPIKAELDAGNLAETEAQLNALRQVDPITIRPELDPDGVAAVAADKALLALGETVRITPEVTDQAIIDTNARLATIEANVNLGLSVTDPEVVRFRQFIADVDPTVVVSPIVDTSAIQRLINGQTYFMRIRPGQAIEAGGYFQRFAAGGQPTGTHIAHTPSHFAQGGNASRYMYGEPSTNGEYFLSMSPAFRDRNLDLWADAGRKLGALSARQDGGGSGGLESRDVMRLLRKMDDLAQRLAMSPPITVMAGTGQEAGSKVFYAAQRRLG